MFRFVPVAFASAALLAACSCGPARHTDASGEPAAPTHPAELITHLEAPPTTAKGDFTPTPTTSKRPGDLQPAEEKRVGTQEPVTIDGVTVTVTSARVGKATVKRFDGEEWLSADECFNIKVRVSVSDDTKIILYEPWQGSFLTAARLRDNFGNNMAGVRFGINTPRGRAENSSVRKGEPVTDVLVFDKPLAKATHLDLDLPGENVGLKGGKEQVYRFRFDIEKPEPPPPPKPQPTPEPEKKPEPKPEKEPEKKPEPKPQPPLPRATIAPPKDGFVLLGSSKFALTEYPNGDAKLREKWEKEKSVLKLTAPAEVEVVGRGPAYATVKLDGKEWVVESKFVPDK